MRSIAKIAFRIILIFLFINTLGSGISGISYSIYTYQHYNDGTSSGLIYLLISVIGTVIILGLIIFLWIKAERVVKFIAGKIDDNQLVINANTSDLFNVLLKFLGIYLLINSLSLLLGIWGHHIYLNYYGFSDDSTSLASEIQPLIVNGFTLIISIILITGSGRIMSFLRNFWNRGIAKD
jgi:hypothetical protein